ncbi:LVIVD repeat-containing protein, partial [Nanoarchaeota archaeon]
NGSVVGIFGEGATGVLGRSNSIGVDGRNQGTLRGILAYNNSVGQGYHYGVYGQSGFLPPGPPGANPPWYQYGVYGECWSCEALGTEMTHGFLGGSEWGGTNTDEYGAYGQLNGSIKGALGHFDQESNELAAVSGRHTAIYAHAEGYFGYREDETSTDVYGAMSQVSHINAGSETPIVRGAMGYYSYDDEEFFAVVGTTEQGNSLGALGYIDNISHQEYAGYFEGNVSVDGNVNVSETLYASNVSSNSPLRLQTAGITRVYVDDSNGNVGVGTESPSQPLNIIGNTNSTGTIFADDPVFPGRVEICAGNWGTSGCTIIDTVSHIIDDHGSTGALMILGNRDSGDRRIELYDDVGVQDELVVSGNLGIGTTAPQERLHVKDAILQELASVPKMEGFYDSATYVDDAYDIHVQGDYAYVVSSVDDMLSIFDISVPSSPSLVGFYTFTTIDGAMSVFVSGDYAYVGAQASKRLVIIDVSRPATPKYVGSYQNNINIGDAMDVYVSGKFAFVASGVTDTLTAISISDPTAPTLVGKYTHATNADNIRKIVVKGKYAYAITPGNSGFSVFDISDPYNIQFTGSYIHGTYLSNAWGLFVEGDYAYVAAFNSDTLTIIDISDPWAPSYKGSYTHSAYLDGATSVFVSGDYAYMTAFITGRLTVVNVSNPSTPGFVTTMLGIGQSFAVQLSGRYAVLPSYSLDRLIVVDVHGSQFTAVEAGNIKTGTLDVKNDASFGNNLHVDGGIQARGSLSAQGDISSGSIGKVCGNRFFTMVYEGYMQNGDNTAARLTALEGEGKTYACIKCQEANTPWTQVNCNAAWTTRWLVCEFKVTC